MKKRKFLVPLAVSLVGLALPATSNANAPQPSAISIETPAKAFNITDGFVIERSDARGAQMSYHQSHRSHMSHRSHSSHQSHFSSYN